MRDPQLAHLPAGASQPRGPGPGRLVERGPGELGAGPDVELHGLGVALQPAGQHVLRDERRPGRRERQVRQRVGPHLVVQGQRVVPVPPVVADPVVALHDQRVHPDPAQPGGQRQPGLPAARDQHLRVAVRVRLRLGPLVQPVVPGEVVGVLHPGRAAGPDRLLVPVDVLQRGQEQPGGRRIPVQQPHERAAPSGARLEVQVSLDHPAPAPPHQPRRHPPVRQPELPRPRLFAGSLDHPGDLVPPAERPVRPLQRQDVPPVPVGREQGGHPRAVPAGQRGLEGFRPANHLVRGDVAGRCLRDHSHAQPFSSPCRHSTPSLASLSTYVLTGLSSSADTYCPQAPL